MSAQEQATPELNRNNDNTIFETKLITTPAGNKQKIILQNGNGPCSLIALCNVLLLSKLHKKYCLNLIEYVNSYENVSLRDLVSGLCECAINLNAGEQAPSDLNHLSKKLYEMNEGLIVDPKFDGDFKGMESSEDDNTNNHYSDEGGLNVFNTFQVSIVHGWCVEPVANDEQSMVLLKYSYEEVQQVLIEAYQLNHNSAEETDPRHKDEVLREVGYIKPFLARTVRQLTEYGIKHINQILYDEDYVVFFRNDHFQTLYKHNGTLYTLVNDAGYKNVYGVVWQSLKSVNGSEDLFYDSQFRLSDGQTENNTQSATNSANADINNNNNNNNNNNDNGLSDEELARILQEEEDARYADNMQRRIAQNDKRQLQQRQRNTGRNGSNGTPNASRDEDVDEYGNAKNHVEGKKSLKKKLFKKKSKCIIL